MVLQSIAVPGLLLLVTITGGREVFPSERPELSDQVRQKEADSLSGSYTLPEIVVTATRFPTASASAPSSVKALFRDDFDARPGSLLSSSLQGLPGLFVRPYGGGAGLQSVSLRGMSSEQTLVLVDGERINSVQNGQADFALLPHFDVERVEVGRGGYSALYGADAVGGVVQVFTRRPSSIFSLSASQSAGSYGLLATELSLSGTAGKVGWRTAVRNEKGKGNYEFLYNDGLSGQRMERTGSDFTTSYGEGRLDYAFSDAVQSSLTLSAMMADRGVPGPVTGPGSGGGSRLTDDALRSRMSVGWNISRGLHLKAVSSVQYSAQSYTDPSLAVGGVPLRSTSINRVFRFSPELDFAPLSTLTGNAGVEVTYSRVTGSQLGGGERWQRSAFLALENTLPLATRIPFELIFYPSLRYDHFSDAGKAFSPKLGVNLGLLRSPVLRIRSSVGTNFRAPTFNELYWTEGGNPNLHPERSTVFDAGMIVVIPLFGEITLDAGYFSITTEERILWAPVSGTLWAPRNVGRVKSQGVELETRWTTFRGAVTLVLNSAWTDARKRSREFPGDETEGKRLIFVPGQTANLQLDLRLGDVRVHLTRSWVSFRYTTEKNDAFLPSYAVTSASVVYGISVNRLTVFFKLEGTNLFDVSYEVVPLYPMPLRELRGTVGVRL